ncbi:MAG TPA: DUF2796 domain-containing protein [Luteibacter sp.]|jgi:hypothetical protein|nr:DUF2796 domain-containing protein [Luteibacter sp.]
MVAKAILGLIGALALATSAAHAAAVRHHEAHVHGITHVTIGIEGDLVKLNVDGPAINFVGFEHPPTNPDETRELNNALVDLRVPTRWLVLPANAQCRQESVDVGNPLADSDGHEDMHASYAYRCASMAALDALDLRLIQVFPHTTHVVIDLALPGGQDRRDLEGAATRVPFGTNQS